MVTLFIVHELVDEKIKIIKSTRNSIILLVGDASYHYKEISEELCDSEVYTDRESARIRGLNPPKTLDIDELIEKVFTTIRKVIWF